MATVEINSRLAGHETQDIVESIRSTSTSAKLSTLHRRSTQVNKFYGNEFCEINERAVPELLRYEITPLCSFRVFFHTTGTVLANRFLWFEQVCVILIFIFSIAVLYALPTSWQERLIRQWIKNELAVFNFVSTLSSMATFLTGFFISLNIARWWRLRTEGIGSIWSASSQLCMFLPQYVTTDSEVLSAVRRYARASLMLIFLRQRKHPHPLQKLEQRHILTAEEVGQLERWNNNLAESIWTWVSAIIAMLYKKGLIQSEQQLIFFLELVQKGRGGAATVGAQLGTQLPMQYVHFISVMVKVHNVGVALLMGLVVEGNIRTTANYLVIGLSILRVFLQPLLFNAILLINMEIMNPFDGDIMDFPMHKYDRDIETDGRSYVDAGKCIPDWIKEWRPLDTPKPRPNLT